MSTTSPPFAPSPAAPPGPRTLFDKLWDSHLVSQEPGHPAVLYVDRHLVHDGTYQRAFQMLEEMQLTVAQPGATLAVVDHGVPTHSSFTHASLRGRRTVPIPLADGLVSACRRHGIPVYAAGDERQGIVHVIGPELGLTWPGTTLACADSHTTTHGAFGVLAFAVGTTQVLHLLATQCVLQRKAKSMRVRIDGALSPGVSAKDLVLAMLARFGSSVAAGHVMEFTGSAVAMLGMEQRMTLCNMGAEFGAKAALVAPDEVTLKYLHGRPFAPTGDHWDRAAQAWLQLRSDPGARFDVELEFDASTVQPMVTFGTLPDMAVGIGATVPDPATAQQPARRAALEEALSYMGLHPGDAMDAVRVDVVFVGSCTNSRIEDLREAAAILRHGRVAPGVRLLVVPGSQAVRRQAEAEGLRDVVLQAGGEWGEPSCSLCVGMNEELASPGQQIASTSNRNFQGRQGPGARTFLVSPATAAASALRGRITDPRGLQQHHGVPAEVPA